MKIKDCFTYDFRDNRTFKIILLSRLVFNFNYRVIVYYRIAAQLKRSKLFRLISKLILLRIARVPGVEFNTLHDIGKGFSIQHAHDIVIGFGAIIKQNVTLYNGVTLGARYEKEIDSDNQENRYPTICENVIIFPGAKVIGNIEIGPNSIIGANSVVLNSFPENSIIAGNPAKRINK